jgi:hypothetical protein
VVSFLRTDNPTNLIAFTIYLTLIADATKLM